MAQEQKLLEYLNNLNIAFIQHDHPPVYTVEEANKHWDNIPGLHCKNIFLRDKKGRKHFLVILPSDKNADIKKLNELMGERFSFASPERLMKYLGLEPGSVSPFGLINDVEKNVTVILDEIVASVDEINFHPNVNTATLTISGVDFKKFLAACGNNLVTCNI